MPTVKRKSFVATRTKPFADPREAAEHHRRQDLRAYREWLAANPNHRDAPHVASLIRALERGPWDTSGWAPVEERSEA